MATVNVTASINNVAVRAEAIMTVREGASSICLLAPPTVAATVYKERNVSLFRYETG